MTGIGGILQHEAEDRAEGVEAEGGHIVGARLERGPHARGELAYELVIDREARRLDQQRLKLGAVDAGEIAAMAARDAEGEGLGSGACRGRGCRYGYVEGVAF